MWKSGEIAPQFLLFSTIFSLYLFQVQLHINLLNVVVRIIFSSILQIWYVEVRISRSISESPLEFEITRVDCILFSLFLQENICCRYSLEASNEYPQHMFSQINKKIPVLFSLKKSALAGVMWRLRSSAKMRRLNSIFAVHIYMKTIWRDQCEADFTLPAADTQQLLQTSFAERMKTLKQFRVDLVLFAESTLHTTCLLSRACFYSHVIVCNPCPCHNSLWR